jgi:tetratricopeptide (TPR) repeat protein
LFKKWFGLGGNGPSNHETGKDLFQRGMAAAIKYRTSEAVTLYTKSYEAAPNPAPLINRAKIYRWRLMFDDSIKDLETATNLDKKQGNQFAVPLSRELRECRLLAQNLYNGKRSLFIADLKDKGFEHVAGRIVDTIFEGNGKLLGCHMVNEVDTVKKFENIADFPSIDTLVNNWMQDQDIIDQNLSDQSLALEYQPKRLIFESMVCVYSYKDMAKLRDTIVRMIWCKLTPPSQRQAFWEAGLRLPLE